VNDLSFLDQIPDPVPEEHRPGTNGDKSGAGRAIRPPPSSRRKEPSLDRAQTRRRRWVALGLSGAWLMTHLIVYGVRQDLAHLSPFYVAVQIGLPFAFAVGSLCVALSPGKLGLGVSLAAIAGLGLLGPSSFWLSALIMPVPRGLVADASLLPALVCLDITLLWAALPLVVAAVSLRRAFPGGAVWRSALVGAAAGLFSGATMNLHCANVDPLHIVVGHGVPVIVGALVGAFVIARWLRT
jgi:negative regulator of sigma F NrsF-like protein